MRESAPICTLETGLTKGHDGCQSVKPVESDPLMTVNGSPVVLVGHKFEPHCDHVPAVKDGSSVLFVNNIPVAKVGSNMTCPDINIQGDGLVLID